MQMFHIQKLLLIACICLTNGKSAVVQIKGQPATLLFTDLHGKDFPLSMKESGNLSFSGLLYVEGDVVVGSMNSSFVEMHEEMVALRVQIQTLQIELAQLSLRK
jgi:hypothetical protein